MGTRYDHSTLEEGCRPSGLMDMGMPITEIARRLGRQGAIHLELVRNRKADRRQRLSPNNPVSR
jgi:IS30 family transposase